MKKNHLPATFLPRQGVGRAAAALTQLSSAPSPSLILPVLQQLKRLQPFPAPTRIPEGFTALAQLVASAGHVLSSPQRWVPLLVLSQQAHPIFGGCSQGYKCRPFPSPSVTWESFALLYKMIRGRGLTFITSSSKQRTKSPQVPHHGPLTISRTRRCKNKSRLSSTRYLSPGLALGATSFPNFVSLTQCSGTGWSLPLLLHQATGGCEFRNSLNAHPEQSLLGQSVP